MTIDYMEKFSDIRDAVVASRTGVVTVRQIDLLELLAAYDALAGAGTKKPAARGGYTAEFEEVWAEYPKRGNHSKAAAFKCWNTRLKEGASMESMIEGMRRFAAVMRAEGRANDKIMHAATFFGPDKRYEDEWIVPRSEMRLAPRAQVQADTNQEALRRLAGIPTFDPNVIDMEQ